MMDPTAEDMEQKNIDEEKPQNIKQLPQIDQSPDLIATIVKGIRVSAQGVEKGMLQGSADPSPPASSPSFVTTPPLSQSQPNSGPSTSISSPPPLSPTEEANSNQPGNRASTFSLVTSLSSRPFSLSSPPPPTNNQTTAPTNNAPTTPTPANNNSPSEPTTTSSFSFSSAPVCSPEVLLAMKESGLKAADFTRDTARKYTVDGTEVKDFAPLVFKKIREMCNISTEQYVRSWTLPMEKMKMNHGAGRSGSLFLKSDDKRFLLKTIPHQELETFLAVLPSYFQHIRDNPNSLIMRVVGLLRIKETFTSWIYIIIFTNILYTEYLEIDEVYDLKGRVPKPGKQGRNKGKKGIVFKDNDLERVFYLNDEYHFVFMQTIEADIKFLAKSNIMDYSFLIGVAKLKKPDDYDALLKSRPPHFQQISMFRRMDGSIEAEDGEEFYLMGIIDCLTDYSTKKKIAHAMKLTLWDPETLSTVDAVMYSARILKFIRGIFPDPSTRTST